MERTLTDSQLRYFNSLSEGDVVECMVTKITHYGAFVKMGSLGGLLPIGEITWGRIKDPADFVKINQRLKLKIISLNRQTHQLALSLKQLLPHPWESLINQYKEGDIAVGHVVDVKDFGAFIMLRPGLEGLIHISDVHEIKDGKTAHDFFRVEETYEVRIIKIDIAARRMLFSLQ